MSVLLMGGIYDVRCWDGFMRHEIPTFAKTGTCVQAMLRFFLRNLKGCDVGIADGRDILITPLRWPQVPDIRTKFHRDWLRYSKVNGGGIHRHMHRQQGDLTRLLLIFQNKKSTLKTTTDHAKEGQRKRGCMWLPQAVTLMIGTPNPG
jgi:hypothetical protein